MEGVLEKQVAEAIARVLGDQNPIGQILSAAFENEVSLTFATFIFALFSIALFRHFTSRSDRPSLIASASPALLTTIGVLGTFVGIFIGLVNFDVGNIDKSVPLFLEGMKVAFVTSILGMGSAVFLRVTYAAVPRKALAESVGPEEIYSVLTDIRDGQNSALSEFRQFAETMAEDNSKALIEALEQAIRDLNTHIYLLNEQFGENLKQLNEAVGALLSWQEQYKDHVEKLTDQFQRSLNGIESETQSVSVLGIGLPAEITEDGVAEINEGDFGPEMAGRIAAVKDM
jgi:biopolymer transport protein ExbB/TolQ